MVAQIKSIFVCSALLMCLLLKSALAQPALDAIQPDGVTVPEGEENAEISGIRILLPGIYRGAVQSDFQPMLKQRWYDFYQGQQDGWHYYLKPAQITIGKQFDECIGEEVVQLNAKQDSLLLIQGLELANGDVLSVPLVQTRVWPKEQMTFTFQQQQYTLSGEGSVVESAMADNERWDKVVNYRLYLSDDKNHKQLLIAQPEFLDTFVQILFIGDLDNDGKPDFIFDTSPDYESKRVVLYLSSKAGQDQLVGLAGITGYQFDC